MASSNHPLNSKDYHVFLSFRGKDTRKNFTAHLYEALDRVGIKTFMDDTELERGADINPELLRAIEQSRFAVVVLSPNYASSKWCLAELAHIMKCMEHWGNAILPIFYYVEPGDVEHQRGSFAKAFAEHEKKFRKDDVNVLKWRDALKKVANFSGWSRKDFKDESQLIEDIVRDVWGKVNPDFKDTHAKLKLVELGKINRIWSMLKAEANDVRFIAIQGKSQMGNTSLARCAYHKVSSKFEVSCILDSVGKTAKSKGIYYLQEQLLKEMTKKTTAVSDTYTGKNMIRKFVENKKVLLVLDDADMDDQIQMLAGEEDWYSLGSRIIITTTHPELVLNVGIPNNRMVEGLSKDDALN